MRRQEREVDRRAMGRVSQVTSGLLSVPTSPSQPGKPHVYLSSFPVLPARNVTKARNLPPVVTSLLVSAFNYLIIVCRKDYERKKYSGWKVARRKTMERISKGGRGERRGWSETKKEEECELWASEEKMKEAKSGRSGLLVLTEWCVSNIQCHELLHPQHKGSTIFRRL